MSASSLGELLRARRDEIVARFVTGVQRKELSPPGVTRSLLVDHVPTYLDELAKELGRSEPGRLTLDAVDVTEAARDHGEQRWDLGYDVEGLIREFGVLRQCMLQSARDAGVQVSFEDLETLARHLNAAIAHAVTAYVKYRDDELSRQRGQLEFLAQAGQMLSASLDYRSTLNSLTTLLVPRLADWCAVHLEGTSVDEMPLAHVDPAKSQVLRSIYRRYPAPSNAPHGHQAVIRTGEAQYVPHIDAAALETLAMDSEHLALLRVIGACSWIIVPLQVQRNTFGALTLVYSESRRHYTKEDLVLATEVARRAAAALDNAKLYEMSQRERSRVEAATRAKDEFVAMVSHELRTPLNAILGWVRLIRNGALPAVKSEHALEVIERNALAQNQLVSDLLDISRVITGKIRINPAQVDLSNVVEMAVEGVRPAADAKRIDLRVDTALTNSIIRGDGERLQQVVWNVLTNAVKFTPKNGSITVWLERLDSDIELTVQDSGQGIAPEFLPHVFESFRQADGGASRAHGGLGIGLSIAKHIVELHGGSISARSDGLGEGATFSVRLPVSPLVSATLGVSRVPATREEVASTELPAGHEGIRVLVVDDEVDARELVGFVLESSGMEVRLAASAAAALEELKSFTPDVIVSDIGMPLEDGYSLIRSIRTLAAEDRRNVAAIALTAFARNEDRTRALVEGFNLHLSKPVEPAALVGAVVTLAHPTSSRPSAPG